MQPKEKTRIIGLDHKALIQVTGRVIDIKEYMTSDKQTAQCFLLKPVFVHKYEKYMDHVWCSFLKESNPLRAKDFQNVKIDDVITIEGFSQKYDRKKTEDVDYSLRRIFLKENHGNEYVY